MIVSKWTELACDVLADVDCTGSTANIDRVAAALEAAFNDGRQFDEAIASAEERGRQRGLEEAAGVCDRAAAAMGVPANISERDAREQVEDQRAAAANALDDVADAIRALVKT